MATGLTRRNLLGAAGIMATTQVAHGQTSSPPASREGIPALSLETVATFGHQVTGVAVSPGGRIFVNFPRWSEDVPVSVAELMPDGSLRPYPDDAWNGWRNATATTMPTGDRFVCVQSVVVDGSNSLWVLDAGAPNSERVLPGAPKLVRIDLSANKVAQVIGFGEDVALQGSYLNDVRFHPDGRTAFVTDSGARGAIVLVDLERGKARSVLDGHPSTQPDRTVEVRFEGKRLVRPDGRGFIVAADGIALSNDGETLYWQPLTGRTLYSVDVRTLMKDDPVAAGRNVRKVGTSNVADGLLMTRQGHLYLTSPEDNSVRVWNGDHSLPVIEDQRLRWPDSLAEATDGTLFVTASRIPDSSWFSSTAPRPLPTTLFRVVRSGSG